MIIFVGPCANTPIREVSLAKLTKVCDIGKSLTKNLVYLRLNEKYREQDIILGEIFVRKTEAGEIITKGDVVAVLSTMGEYLPLEEYEFI